MAKVIKRRMDLDVSKDFDGAYYVTVETYYIDSESKRELVCFCEPFPDFKKACAGIEAILVKHKDRHCSFSTEPRRNMSEEERYFVLGLVSSHNYPLVKEHSLV